MCSAPGAPHAGGRGAAPSRARLTDEEDLRLGVMGDEEVGAERSVEYGKGSPLVRGADNRHGRADLHAARNPAAVVRGNVSPKAAATPVLPSAAAAAPQSGGSGPRAGSPRPAGASAGSAALPGSLGEREDEARARDEDEYAAGPAADDDDEEEDQDEDEDADQDQFGFDDEVESDEDEDEDAAGRGASAAEAPKKVKGGKDKSTSSRLSADARPIANSAIRVPQLRVVDASAGSNVNLGVMPTGQALALAREKRVDLVLVNATAVPPVARLIALHKLLAAAKEAEAERRKASKKSQPKEVRLTSRISRELRLMSKHEEAVGPSLVHPLVNLSFCHVVILLPACCSCGCSAGYSSRCHAAKCISSLCLCLCHCLRLARDLCLCSA